MTSETPERLSPDGHDRRQAMLPVLIEAMQGVHRRRQRRRRVVAAALLVIAGAAVAIAALPRHELRPDTRLAETTVDDAAPPLPPLPPLPPPPPPRSVVVETVRTAPPRAGVIVRSGTAPRTPRLDDAALAAELVAIGRPAGVIRSGERVWLTANVVDGG